MFQFISDKTGTALRIVFIVLRAVLQGLGLFGDIPARKRDRDSDPGKE
jgi:hypothetical protein